MKQLDLIQEYSSLTSEREILIGVINRFIGLFSRELQRSTTNQTDVEYPFVAMDTRQVFEQLLFVNNYLKSRNVMDTKDRIRFLDIGCGFGNVLLLAEQFDFAVYGLEKDRASIKVAREFFEPHQILEEDIKQFSGYADFDVVYYFCPLTEGEREFELFVENEIKKGAILIANYKRSKNIYHDSRFRKISNELPIWEKME